MHRKRFCGDEKLNPNVRVTASYRQEISLRESA